MKKIISTTILSFILSISTFGADKKVEKKAEDKSPRVLLSTSMGDITVELDSKSAPISTKNFLEYVKSGHYKGTIFHRVIRGFMIQGGGFSQDMKEKSTKAAIKNEATNGLKNLNYTLAMARTNEVNSATAQFFINVKDNGFLDHTDASFGYAVFGKVVSGKEVVNKIEGVSTANAGVFDDVPVVPVVIKDTKTL